MTDQKARNLSALLQAVGEARSDLGDARRATASPDSLRVAARQRLLLAALERYAAALASRGSPTPYRMRDEVAMYRAMFGPQAPRRLLGRSPCSTGMPGSDVPARRELP